MLEKKELLNSYIKTNIAPILIDFIEGKDIPNSYLISANISQKELNGHYEKTNFCPPTWFKDLEQDKEKIILVIDKIDTIPQEEQLKFIEILKYKQVSTFKLKDNIRIILTAKEKSKVDNEIKSLSAIV